MRIKTSLKKLEPKWKLAGKAVVKSKRKHIIKKIVRIGIVLLLMFVIASIGVGVYERKWRGSDKLVIVLGADRLAVLTLDRVVGDGLLVVMAEDALINSAMGYGKYRAGSLVRLDRQEDKKGNLVKYSLAKHLGILVDGVVIQSGNIQSKRDVSKLILKQLFVKIFGGKYSDLSTWDLIKIEWSLMMFNQSDFEVIDLVESIKHELVKLPDGSVVYDVSQDYLDQFSKKYFMDEKIALEDMTLGIVNTTGHRGLGSGVARMLGNIGFHIVLVDNDDSNLLVSELVVSHKDLMQSLVVRKLKMNFGVEPRLKESVEGENTGSSGNNNNNNSSSSSRIKVLLKLGGDVKKRYY